MTPKTRRGGCKGSLSVLAVSVGRSPPFGDPPRPVGEDVRGRCRRLAAVTHCVMRRVRGGSGVQKKSSPPSGNPLLDTHGGASNGGVPARLFCGERRNWRPISSFPGGTRTFEVALVAQAQEMKVLMARTTRDTQQSSMSHCYIDQRITSQDVRP